MFLKGYKIGKDHLGFTLAEVMAVVVILGVLAALALPNFNIQVKKAKNQEAIQILLALYGAQKDHAKEHDGVYAGNIADLDIEVANIKNFGGPYIAKDGIVPCTGDSYLASLTANDGYILYVLEDSTIVCAAGDGSCPAELCTKMGF